VSAQSIDKSFAGGLAFHLQHKRSFSWRSLSLPTCALTPSLSRSCSLS